MKLYEVNKQLEDLLNKLEPDLKTGELPAKEEDIIRQIDTLAMKREDILQCLAKLALNARASVATLKAEEKRLKNRRIATEDWEDHLMAILEKECGGEKTDLGVATLFYRKTSHVEITDEETAFQWLRENGHDDCYRIPKPEISKTYVGKLIDAGTEVPGAERVNGVSCYLK